MSRKPLRHAAVVLTVSLGLFAGGCAAPSAEPAPSAEAGTATAVAPAQTAPAQTAPPAETPSANADAGPAGTDVVLQQATGALVEAPPRPVSLAIDGTDINVGVIEVGIESNNEMEIPDSFYEAGWYRFGPAPGAAEGNAVLAAHIDIGTEVMPFTQLKDVQVGTIVTVGRENAEPLRYQVTDVRNVPKASLDTAEIFQRDGEHQLKILTCGGKWLADQEDYEDNVVLTASPL